MLIAFYTSDDSLFTEVSRTFHHENNLTLVHFKEVISLIRFIQRECVALVLFDAGSDASSIQSLLSWRTCHFRSDVLVLQLGRSWECKMMIEASASDVDEIVVGSSAQEIHTRVKRLFARRSGISVANRISAGGYFIDHGARTATFAGNQVSLTLVELSLAWLLFRNVGSLLTREQIGRAVWGKNANLAGRSLEQHIYTLRKKLALDRRSGVRLRTVYAIGYVLDLNYVTN